MFALLGFLDIFPDWPSLWVGIKSYQTNGPRPPTVNPPVFLTINADTNISKKCWRWWGQY